MNLFVFYIVIQIMGISVIKLQAQLPTTINISPECQISLNKTASLQQETNKQLLQSLEQMEQKFQKQEQQQIEDENVLNELEIKLQALQTVLEEKQQDYAMQLKDTINSHQFKKCNAEDNFVVNFQKIIKLQNSIAATLNVANEMNFIDDSDNEIDAVLPDTQNFCDDFYYKSVESLSDNIEVLQKIDDKLSKSSKLYLEESVEHKKTIESIPSVLKYLEEKDQPTYCVRTKEKDEICSATPYPTSCVPFDSPFCVDNKCVIKNAVHGTTPFPVVCEQDLDGGGWLIIQRRIDGAVDFERDWSEYKKGFGNLEGEFWLGLDKIHALTKTLAPAELLIQLQDHNDVLKYAKFTEFYIGNETEFYELKKAEDYTGNAGDSFSLHKGNQFSTKDMDHDMSPYSSCAEIKRGAWWYNNCLWSNLNGFYYPNGEVASEDHGRGICWSDFHGYKYSMKFVQMMIRPRKISLDNVEPF